MSYGHRKVQKPGYVTKEQLLLPACLIQGMNRSFASSSSPTPYTDFLKDLLVKFSSPWQGNMSAEPVSCLIEIHCQVDSFDGKEVAFRPVKQLSSLKP